MDFSITTFLGYDVLGLSGEITVSELPTFVPGLTKHVQHHADKHYVIDMERVRHLDSSAIRLIVNLKKLIENNNRKIYILKPSKTARSLLEGVHLTKVIPCLDSHQELQREVIESRYELCVKYTRPDGPRHKLTLRCPVCGSTEVAGYLLNELSFSWSWVEDDPFPTPKSISGEDLDYFSLLPIVCCDCFFSGIEPRLFAMVEDTKVRVPSMLDDQSKMILGKGIKRRKKMLEGRPDNDPLYFLHPRSYRAVYDSYRLAENCAHSMALEGTCATPFSITHLNYLAIMFAEHDDKPTLIDTCRTWAIQALQSKVPMTHQEKAICRFILFNSCLGLNRIKEATEAFKDFTKLIESLGESSESFSSMRCPRFWYDQAKRIWEKEIQSQSSLFRAQED